MYFQNASLYGCTIVKFKAFTGEAEQRSNSADKGFDVILIILRFQKILKAAKSCLKIAEVTTSISNGAFLCRVTKTRNMKLNMLFAVQKDSVINSNVDFTADKSKIQHQSSDKYPIIYHFMTYFSTDILTKMYKLGCAFCTFIRESDQTVKNKMLQEPLISLIILLEYGQKRGRCGILNSSRLWRFNYVKTRR